MCCITGPVATGAILGSQMEDSNDPPIVHCDWYSLFWLLSALQGFSSPATWDPLMWHAKDWTTLFCMQNTVAQLLLSEIGIRILSQSNPGCSTKNCIILQSIRKINICWFSIIPCLREGPGAIQSPTCPDHRMTYSKTSLISQISVVVSCTLLKPVTQS